MGWTEARISLLTQLWRQGVSASGIAEALGAEVSRSAVLGKLHRLKLLKSRKAASAPRPYGGGPDNRGGRACVGATSRPGRALPPHPRQSPWRNSAFRPLAGTSPRHWLEREARACAFPVGGDGEATLACCAPTSGRSAYCPAHHAVVFKPVPESVRRADEKLATVDQSPRRAA